jgi:predicted RNase H-like nuclease
VVAVGIDACKTGWIAVALDDSEVAAYYLPSVGDLTAVIGNPDSIEAIAIDIPIGLPDSGRRRADLDARVFLGPRRNSIFFTPMRAAVEAATHEAATALSRSVTGFGVSQQSYALAKKILEVEAWLPSAPCQVREVHPEVSFGLLIGRPASASKKTWAGMVERRQALLGVGINLEGVPVEVGIHAAVDDMLDAAVVAWSARRVAGGLARSFPDPPSVSANGQPVAIWA